METTCAVVRLSDGLVMNTIVALPSDPAPEGCQIVEIRTGEACSIGWCYADKAFHGPRSYVICADKTNEVVSFASVSYVSPEPVAPAGGYVVQLTGDMSCDIGWTWDGSRFNPPVA